VDAEWLELIPTSALASDGGEEESWMKQPPPVSSPGFRETPSEVHLDSWKEIAAYLKRDVSTAQRWEKREGMPVHRHLHDKRGSVYALTSELDTWFEGRKLRLQGEAQEPGVETPLAGEGEHGQRTARAPRWLVLAAVAAVAVISVTFYFLTRFGTVGATGPKIKSLAVLPLRNISADSGQQYFVDGLTDELTTDLAKLGKLRVISRSSAILYADTGKPLPQIAKDLNVDAVLMGTVERSGNRVRVRTELVRPGTDEVLWAETYNRDLADVLHLEAEVSRTIAREVGIKLTSQVQRRMEHNPTTSTEAHDAYLRARYFMDRDDKEGAANCLRYFQDAIAKDPKYTAAYAGLSRCYGLAYDFKLVPLHEAMSKAKAAAITAVELDEESAEGHAELGGHYFWVAWNFSAAEREYERALDLDPNSSPAHSNYSFLLRNIGRTEQAVNEIESARDLDPLSLERADEVGWQLLYARRYDEAIDHFHNLLEMNPNYRRARWGLARVYELKGMYKETISECLKIPGLPSIDPFTKALFERRCSLYEKVYGGGQINRKWFESARREIKDAIGRDDDAYSIATLYAETGESEKALDLLEQAYAGHDSALLELKVDPRLDSVRSSPRFQALLRRMNFPP
jgi:TolB-like protein